MGTLANGRLGLPQAALGITAESFGASPSASAAQNASAIQKALNQTGFVTLNTPGVYQVDKTLLIDDYTELSLGQGVQLYIANGSNCALIRGIDTQNAFTTAMVSVSGGTATFTEYGHTRTVGQQVYIEAAQGNTSLNGAQTITAVTANTWSFSNAGTNPTNPAGSRIFVARYNPLSGANFTRASNVVTVTETGHKRQSGDHVYVAGLGGANSFNGMAEITSSSPDAGTWTYANTGTNETATGTAQLLGNTGIKLTNFSYDGNKANNNNDLYQAFTAIFVNIGNSVFDLPSVQNATWRALTLMNAGHNSVPRIHNANGGVAMQIDSFCNGNDFGVLEAYNCTDDIFAMGVTYGSGSFGDTACPSGQASNGFNTVKATRGYSPTAHVKLFCYTGYDNGVLRVGEISGTGAAIQGDTTSGVSGGTMTEFIVDRIDVTPTAVGQTTIAFGGLTNYGNVRIGNVIDNTSSLATTFFCNIGATQINKLTWDNLQSLTYGTSYAPINLANGAVIQDLSLNGCLLSGGNGQNFVQIQSGASVRDLRINSVEYRGAGAALSANFYGNLVTAQAGSILEHLWVNGLSLTTGQAGAVFTLSQGSQTYPTEIDIVNVYADNNAKCSYFLGDSSSATSGNIRFSNMKFYSGPANYIFTLAGSGTWRIQGENVTHVAGKFALLTSGTVSVSIDCPSAQIDLGASAGAPPARLIPLKGDKLYNTNSTGTGLYGRTAAGAWQLIF